MRISTWIRGIVDSLIPATGGQKPVSREEKGETPLVDVTDGYFLVEEARKWGVSLVRKNMNDFRDFRDRIGIRRRVRRSLDEAYNVPEIVEEVTEKIYTDSREDHRLRKLFT